MAVKEQLYICTTAQYHSITRAAEVLYISPSALSAYIRSIEKQYGVRLFERRGHQMIPTEEGREYIQRAEKIIDLQKEINQVLNQKEGIPVTLSLQTRRAVDIMSAILKGFARQYPGSHLEIREEGFSEIRQSLELRQSDAALCNGSLECPGISRQTLLEEPIIACVPAGFALNRKAFRSEKQKGLCLHFEDLVQEILILPKKDESLRHVIDARLEAEGIRIARYQEAQNFLTIQSMIQAQLGCGFSRLGYLSHLHRPGVLYYYVDDPCWSDTLDFFSRPSFPDEKMLERLRMITLQACRRTFVRGQALICQPQE